MSAGCTDASPPIRSGSADGAGDASMATDAAQQRLEYLFRRHGLDPVQNVLYAAVLAHRIASAP